MISLDEIENTILELEAKDTSYAVIERLAWLYIVRDHIRPTKLTENVEGDEFCEACSNIPYNHAISVLSEHMEVIKALYPREYRTIIDRLNEK